MQYLSKRNSNIQIKFFKNIISLNNNYLKKEAKYSQSIRIFQSFSNIGVILVHMDDVDLKYKKHNITSKDVYISKKNENKSNVMKKILTGCIY